MTGISNVQKVPIPQQFQGILWSTKVEDLDTEKDQVYIINQAFSYGTWPMIQWLFKIYPSQKLKQVFLDHPIKDYTDSRFYFVKNFLLHLTIQQLNPNRYVKNLPRDLG